MTAPGLTHLPPMVAPGRVSNPQDPAPATRELLRERAAAGCADAMRCLRFLEAPRSPGRPPADDHDALLAICDLLTRRIPRSTAIAMIGRHLRVDRRTRERWSRKLKRFSAK